MGLILTIIAILVILHVAGIIQVDFQKSEEEFTIRIELK